tara:strand:+ start:1091 stop:1780 length:690 start_codon:yes stop_codon:yes gene_type:complete
MDIQLKVYNMLKENTGTHFLDSGGAYGRHFEKNQEKSLQDFINEEEQTFEVGFNKDGNADEVLRNVSVFHFLAGSGSNLEINKICKEFNKLNALTEDLADCEAYGVRFTAWEYLESELDTTINRTWNTCNYDCDLSQTLQGASLTINDEDYILIQIHGGCDVRGGYTDAMLFKCEEGIINEYLFEYMDNCELMECELEYIDKMYDWSSGEVYEGKKLDEIKKQLLELGA